MRDHLIGSFKDLFTVAQYYRRGRWVFRGVASSNWAVLPKVGRRQVELEYEARIFEYFSREAIAHSTPFPATDWEIMALAQHHGLATRLVDWSENPLVAAFFACRDHVAEDGAVYMLETPHVIKDYSTSPFDITRVARYRPRHLTRRITAQRGLFTIHPQPGVPLALSNEGSVKLHRAIIPSTAKAKLLWNLSRFGINAASLFPDLDGLCAHVSWMYSSDDPSEERHIADPKLQSDLGWSEVL